MRNLLNNIKSFIFGKKYQKCPHGWEIYVEDKLPYRYKGTSLQVCPDCAMDSAIKQLNESVKLWENKHE